MPAMLDMIDLDYPETTCHLPLLNTQCTVRCLTVGATSKIRTSATFGHTMINSINELIYRCIVQKPDGMFEDFNLFRKQLPTRDRDALLYSILEASESLEQVFPITCPQCGRTFDVKLKLDDCFDAVLYDGEPGSILDVEEEVVLNLTKATVKFYLKVPTLDRERRVLLHVGQRNIDPQILTMLLTIDRVEVYRKDSEEMEGVIRNIDFDQLETLCNRLRLKQQKLITDHYRDTLGKYGVSLKFTFSCPDNACGYIEKDMPIDLMQWFFRAISE